VSIFAVGCGTAPIVVVAAKIKGAGGFFDDINFVLASSCIPARSKTMEE
jgi:hypothetical protein